MILKSIHLGGWRCFANPIEVGPFGERINVIHAPNAVGKSTIFDALLRGMFDGHRVSGNDVNSLRPWGRALAPEVTIEFNHDGTEYRLAKRFLDQPSSELYRKEGEQFVRLAEGDTADNRIRKILSGISPGRGLSRPVHWGLSQILWAPQGNLEISALSGNLVANIQESLGVQVSGSGMGPLEEKIEAAYGQIFTPTGKLKSGKDSPVIVKLLAQLEELNEERQTVLIRMEEFENSSRRVEDLRAQRAQAKRDEEAPAKALHEARTTAEVYVNLLSEEERRNEQVKSAEARYDELKQRTDSIDKARGKLAGARETLSRLETDLPVQLKEVENLETRTAKSKAHLEEIRKGLKDIENCRREAEAARRYIESVNKLANTEELIRKIRDTEGNLNRLKKDRIGLVAPDSKTLQAIRRAIKARDEAQVHLDASLITLEIVPEKKTILDILTAEETGRKEVLPEKPVEVKGAPEVVVDLKGTARIRARGPAGSIKELRGKVTGAVRQIEELSAEFGTADIERLESLSEKAKELEQKMAENKSRLNTLLSGRTVEETEKEKTKATTQIDQILIDYPEWRSDPPDLNIILTKADEIERNYNDEVKKAESEWEKEQNALLLASEKKATTLSELNSTEKQVESLSTTVAESTRDGRDDRERLEELRKISLEWDAGRAALQDIQVKLKSYAGDPRNTVETLEKQLNEAGMLATHALGNEKKEEGRLQELASEGPYSALSRVEEQISCVKEEFDREDLHTNAIRLLHDTTSLCRKEALTAIARPVEELAARTLQRIAGTRFEHVHLAETFQPEGVNPRVTETAIAVEELSGGEKEQIHLAVRLALAEVLSKEERQLVVFDDILTATDTGRLARILNVLEEATRQLQIIILTCHPERYRGMEETLFFDLEELIK